MSNFHIKSYSESTNNTNNNNGFANDKLSSLRNDSVIVAESAANYVILTHSDSQKSLDRLFNPPTSDTSVPLRQRNLPPSFFNPIGAQLGSKASNGVHNENHIKNGQSQGKGMHLRSLSLDQRPAGGMARGLHFRTPSVLTSLDELKTPNSGSGSALMSNSINSLDQTNSMNTISDGFQSCQSLQNSATGHINQHHHHASNGHIQQHQQHQQQLGLGSSGTTLNPPPPAPAQIIHENETKRTYLTGITHSHHYRNYSSPAYMHQNEDQGRNQIRQQQVTSAVACAQLTSNGHMQPPSSGLAGQPQQQARMMQATSFQSHDMPSFMDTEDMVSSTTPGSNDFCHNNFVSHNQNHQHQQQQVHSTSSMPINQQPVQQSGQFHDQLPGSTSYQQQQQNVVFQQVGDATSQQSHSHNHNHNHGHHHHQHSSGYIQTQQAVSSNHLVNNQHPNHGHPEQTVTIQHSNLHHQSFSTGHLVPGSATTNQVQCVVHQPAPLQQQQQQLQTNGHHHHHMVSHNHNHNHGHHHHHHHSHSHQLHQHPHQHNQLHHQHQHLNQVAGSRLTGAYQTPSGPLDSNGSFQIDGSPAVGCSIGSQQQSIATQAGHMAAGNQPLVGQASSGGVIYSQMPSNF